MRDEVVQFLLSVLEDEGAESAAELLEGANGHLDEAVALLVDEDMDVREALSFAEGLLGLGRDLEAAEVVGETLRAAFRLPLVDIEPMRAAG